MSQWSCSACTLLNSSSRWTCEVCDTPAPNIVQRKKTSKKKKSKKNTLRNMFGKPKQSSTKLSLNSSSSASRTNSGLTRQSSGAQDMDTEPDVEILDRKPSGLRSSSASLSSSSSSSSSLNFPPIIGLEGSVTSPLSPLSTSSSGGKRRGRPKRQRTSGMFRQVATLSLRISIYIYIYMYLYIY